MTNMHTSYRARKQRRINDITAKMRAAKERKRIEHDYTPRPDRPELCMQVVVHEFECQARKTTVYNLQACPVRQDSYWVWEGAARWEKPMGKATFFRMLCRKHPRMMPIQ